MAVLKKSGVLWREGKRVKSGLLFTEVVGKKKINPQTANTSSWFAPWITHEQIF